MIEVYLYTCIIIYYCGDCLSEVTTMRVSKATLEMLERFKEKFKVGSLDEAIQALIRQQRKAAIDKAFGLDKDRIKPFTEEDRGEDRS